VTDGTFIGGALFAVVAIGTPPSGAAPPRSASQKLDRREPTFAFTPTIADLEPQHLCMVAPCNVNALSVCTEPPSVAIGAVE
jgi:hypothetical protein